MNAAQEREIRAVKAHGLALATRREDRLAGRDKPARPVTPWESYMRKVELRPDGVWFNELWLRSLIDSSSQELWEELMERSGASVRQDSGTRWMRAHAVAAFFDTGALGPNSVGRLRIEAIHKPEEFGEEIRSARVFRDRHLIDTWLGKVFLSQVVAQVQRHDSMVEKVEIDFDVVGTRPLGGELLRLLPLELGILQKLGGDLPEMLLWIRKLPAAAPGL